MGRVARLLAWCERLLTSEVSQPGQCWISCWRGELDPARRCDARRGHFELTVPIAFVPRIVNLRLQHFESPIAAPPQVLHHLASEQVFEQCCSVRRACAVDAGFHIGWRRVNGVFTHPAKSFENPRSKWCPFPLGTNQSKRLTCCSAAFGPVAAVASGL